MFTSAKTVADQLHDFTRPVFDAAAFGHNGCLSAVVDANGVMFHGGDDQSDTTAFWSVEIDGRRFKVTVEDVTNG